jgi:hypothetical protein
MNTSSKSIGFAKRMLLGSARELGVVALLIASIATLLAIFIVEENWRGDRAWAAYKRDLKARGESVDLMTFASPPIPDHLNFFKEPMLERILLRKDSADQEKFIAEYTLGSYFPKKLPPNFSEIREALKRRQLFNGPDSGDPAADVRLALHRFDPVFDALRNAAVHRPQAGLNAGSPLLLPDTVFSSKVARALILNAHASLAVGDNAAAYLDTYTLLRFAESLEAQPGPVIMLHLANSLKGLASGVIEEGCTQGFWTEHQLAEFQRLLVPADPLGSYVRAIKVERAGLLYFLDADPRPAEFRQMFPFWVIHGWVQQNKVRYSKFYDTEVLPTFAEKPGRDLVEPLKKLNEMTKRMQKSTSLYDRLVRGGINLGSLGETYIGATAKVQHAATLCALERYRLARGSWPAKLENLVPTYLPAVPRGFFNGEAVEYEVLAVGGIRLTAAGPEGRMIFEPLGRR